MVIEILFLIAMAAVFFGGAWGWEAVRNWRDRGQHRRLTGLVRGYEGRLAEEAVSQFGEPEEIVRGSSGRRLFVWKRSGHAQLLVVSITVEADGRISKTNCAAV